MIMIDFLQDDAWNTLRHKMNAPLIDANAVPAVVVGGLSLQAIKQLADTGFDTTLDQLNVAPDQTLFFKDARVRVELAGDQTGLPIIHLAYCTTLQACAPQQRCQISTHTVRYVDISVVNNEGEWGVVEQQQPICLDCLRTLNWQGMHHRLTDELEQHILQKFDLEHFYQQYPSLLPLHNYQQLWLAETDRLNTYTHDWPEIAAYVKAYSRWICPTCQNAFAHHHSELHVDHLNGKKYDNTIGNLRISCHSCRADSKRQKLRPPSHL